MIRYVWKSFLHFLHILHKKQVIIHLVRLFRLAYPGQAMLSTNSGDNHFIITKKFNAMWQKLLLVVTIIQPTMIMISITHDQTLRRNILGVVHFSCHGITIMVNSLLLSWVAQQHCLTIRSEFQMKDGLFLPLLFGSIWTRSLQNLACTISLLGFGSLTLPIRKLSLT